MAVIHFRGNMPVLRISTRISMVLPDLSPEIGKKFPVLWLLSDEGKTSADYINRMDLESVSEKFGIAIVIPEGLHSDYEDMMRGLDWYTYISSALPKFLREKMALSDDPEENFVFGFGMGGLGAVRLALRMPEFARGFGACDTDLDVFDLTDRTPEYLHKMRAIYGDDLLSDAVLDKSDVYRLAKAQKKIPRICLFASEDSEYTGSMEKLVSMTGDRIRFREVGSDESRTHVLTEALMHFLKG